MAISTSTSMPITSRLHLRGQSTERTGSKHQSNIAASKTDPDMRPIIDIHPQNENTPTAPPPTPVTRSPSPLMSPPVLVEIPSGYTTHVRLGGDMKRQEQGDRRMRKKGRHGSKLSFGDVGRGVAGTLFGFGVVKKGGAETGNDGSMDTPAGLGVVVTDQDGEEAIRRHGEGVTGEEEKALGQKCDMEHSRPELGVDFEFEKGIKAGEWAEATTSALLDRSRGICLSSSSKLGIEETRLGQGLPARKRGKKSQAEEATIELEGEDNEESEIAVCPRSPGAGHSSETKSVD